MGIFRVIEVDKRNGANAAISALASRGRMVLIDERKIELDSSWTNRQLTNELLSMQDDLKKTFIAINTNEQNLLNSMGNVEQ